MRSKAKMAVGIRRPKCLWMVVFCGYGYHLQENVIKDSRWQKVKALALTCIGDGDQRVGMPPKVGALSAPGEPGRDLVDVIEARYGGDIPLQF